MSILKRVTAEFIGTFVLVLGGCGSAVLTAAFPNLGIGFLGVALAFGLTVLTMAYAIGHISGGHMNPAVSLGLWAGKRFPASDLLPYIVAQVIGAIVGAGVLYLNCKWTTRLEYPAKRACRQRLRRPLARWVFAPVRADHRSGAYLYFPHHNPGRYGQTCPAGVCTSGYWAGIDPGTPGGDPGHQHVGQPGPQYRSGNLRRWLGARAVMAVLGCPSGRGTSGRVGIPLLCGGRIKIRS